MATGFVDKGSGKIVRGKLGEVLAKKDPSRGVSVSERTEEEKKLNIPQRRSSGGGGSSRPSPKSQPQVFESDLLGQTFKSKSDRDRAEAQFRQQQRQERQRKQQERQEIIQQGTIQGQISEQSEVQPDNFVPLKDTKPKPGERITEVGNVIPGTKEEAQDNPFVFEAGVVGGGLAQSVREGEVLAQQSRGVTRQGLASSLVFGMQPSLVGTEQSLRAIESKERTKEFLRTEKEFSEDPESFRGEKGFKEDKTDSGTQYFLEPSYFENIDFRKRALIEYSKLPTDQKKKRLASDAGISLAQLPGDGVKFFSQGLTGAGEWNELGTAVTLPGAVERLSQVPVSSPVKTATNLAFVSIGFRQGVSNVRKYGFGLGLKETARQFSTIQFSKTKFYPDISKEKIIGRGFELPANQDGSKLTTFKAEVPSVSGGLFGKTEVRSVLASKGGAGKSGGIGKVRVDRPAIDITGGELRIGRRIDVFNSVVGNRGSGEAFRGYEKMKLDFGTGSPSNVMLIPKSSFTTFIRGGVKETNIVFQPDGKAILFKGGGATKPTEREDISQIVSGRRTQSTKFEINEKPSVRTTEKEVILGTKKMRFEPQLEGFIKRGGVRQDEFIGKSSKGSKTKQVQKQDFSDVGTQAIAGINSLPKTGTSSNILSPSKSGGKGTQTTKSEIKTGIKETTKVQVLPSVVSATKFNSLQSQISGGMLSQKIISKQIDKQFPRIDQTPRFKPPEIPVQKGSTIQPPSQIPPSIPKVPSIFVPGKGVPGLPPLPGLFSFRKGKGKKSQLGSQPFGRIPTVTGAVQYNVLGLTTDKPSALERIGGVRRVIKKKKKKKTNKKK